MPDFRRFSRYQVRPARVSVAVLMALLFLAAAAEAQMLSPTGSVYGALKTPMEGRSRERRRSSSDRTLRERRRRTLTATFASWVLLPGSLPSRSAAQDSSPRGKRSRSTSARTSSSTVTLQVAGARKRSRSSGAAAPRPPQSRDRRHLRRTRTERDPDDAGSLGDPAAGPGNPALGRERRRRLHGAGAAVRRQGLPRRSEHVQPRRHRHLARRLFSDSLRLRRFRQHRRRHGRLRSLALGARRDAQPRDQARDEPDRRLRARALTPTARSGTTALEVGGPLWKDRLWIWGAGASNSYLSQTFLLPDDEPSGARRPTATGTRSSRRSSSRRTPSLSPTNFDRLVDGRGAGPRSEPSTWDVRLSGESYKVEDSHVFSERLFATLTFSYVPTHREGGSQGRPRHAGRRRMPTTS